MVEEYLTLRRKDRSMLHMKELPGASRMANVAVVFVAVIVAIIIALAGVSLCVWMVG